MKKGRWVCGRSWEVSEWSWEAPPVVPVTNIGYDKRNKYTKLTEIQIQQTDKYIKYTNTTNVQTEQTYKYNNKIKRTSSVNILHL